MSLLEHLLSRDLDPEKYTGMHVVEEEELLWVPLWNLSGQLVGYQTYRPKASKNDRALKPELMKYFTYVSKVDNKSRLAAFGFDKLSLDNGKTCQRMLSAVH